VSKHPHLEVVMISRGEPEDNRAKVKEHRLTFPAVLQQQWEISRMRFSPRPWLTYSTLEE
jgi:hypothetical protein